MILMRTAAGINKRRTPTRALLWFFIGSQVLMEANQGELHENINDLFAGQEHAGWDGVAYSHHEQLGKDHGRRERRQCRVITDPEELAYVDPHRQWDNLGAVAKVSYPRDSAEGSPEDTRYYICSYSGYATHAAGGAEPLKHRKQPALGVGRGLGRGSQSSVRAGCADRHLAVTRHLAPNLLKQERSAKVGVKAKRKKANWDFDYLLKVLFQ